MLYKILAFLGFSFSLCSLSAQKLDSISSFPGFARDDAVAQFYDGKIYCGLGYGIGFQVLGDWWAYSIANREWERFDMVPFEKRQYSASLVWKNYIYIFGGWTSNTEFHKDLWRFDCIEGTWTEMQELPGRARWAAAAITIGDQALLGLGQDTTDHFKDVWIYDFQNDSWTDAPELPGLGRSKMVGTELQGMALVGPGQGSGRNLNDFWLFNPLNKSWKELNLEFDSVAYMQYSSAGPFVFTHGGQEFNSNFRDEFRILSFEDIQIPKEILNFNIKFKARGSMILDDRDDVYLLWGLDTNFQRTKSLEKIVFSNPVEKKSQASIFPNPSADQVLIQSDKMFDGLKIFGTSGKLEAKMEFQNSSARFVDVSTYKAGLYFFCLMNSENDLEIIPLFIQ